MLWLRFELALYCVVVVNIVENEIPSVQSLFALIFSAGSVLRISLMVSLGLWGQVFLIEAISENTIYIMIFIDLSVKGVTLALVIRFIVDMPAV